MEKPYLMATIRSLLICVLLLLLGHPDSHAQPNLREVYLSQVGVREVPEGSNWGPEVRKYLLAVNVKTPAPWCAAFVRWCFERAQIPTTITAWSPTAHNSKHVVYFGRRIIEEPRSGDVFTLWFPKMKRIAHTGFYHRRVNSKFYETVEGNTSEGGSRDGGGVYKRYRSFNSTYSISRWQK